MLLQFLLGFLNVGIFAALVLVGLSFEAFGFDMAGLSRVSWMTGGLIVLASGVVGGLVAVVRELIESRRPLLGHTLGEKRRGDGFSFWDLWPW